MVVRELVRMFTTVAKLAEFGAIADAYHLLDTIDELAIGLELDNAPLYVVARAGAIHFTELQYELGIEFRQYLEMSITLAYEGQCEEAWKCLDDAAKLAVSAYKLGMLHEARTDVEYYCSSSSSTLGSDST